MKNIAYAVVAMAALAACDGVGGGDGGGTGGPTDPGTPPPVNDVPAAIAGDLKAGTFDASGETLVVRITFDADELDAAYTRNPAYDVPGYLAFTAQDDPLDRFFTGFGRESSDGSVQAVLAADGGQFTKYFGGATYRQTGAYTAPTSGLVSYAGTYVGTLNIGTRNGTLPTSGPAELLPRRSARVTGDVFLNADFTDGSVAGSVYNREALDVPGAPVALPSLFLIPADIEANGSFAGEVEDAAQEGLGSFAGIFGGTNAAAVAGGIRLEGEFFPGIDNEEEYGIFVLDQCGTTPVICEDVDQLGE